MSGISAIGHGEASRLHFASHLAGMLVSMMVGMMVSAAIFLSAVGMSVDEALRRHAVLFVVVQALGMSIAMVAWMRFRRHPWRSCFEMTAAMVVPAVVLICLRLAGAVSGPICGAYCMLSLVAMLLVMFYRRRDSSLGSGLHS